jgi:hypothetical protein
VPPASTSSQTLPQISFIWPVSAPPGSAPNQPLPQNRFLFYLFLRHQRAHQTPKISADFFYLTCFCATRECTKSNFAAVLVFILHVCVPLVSEPNQTLPHNLFLFYLFLRYHLHLLMYSRLLLLACMFETCYTQQHNNFWDEW